MPAISMFNIVSGNPQSIGTGETSFAFDTTINTVKCYKNGSTLYELVEKDAAQTLTNKTITGIVAGTSTTSFSVIGAEAGNASLILDADEGDDAADTWTLRSTASGNALDFLNDATVVATMSSAGAFQNTTSHTVMGAEAGNASLILDADEGDDNADTWTIQSAAADNDLDFLNHTTAVATLTSAGALSILSTFSAVTTASVVGAEAGDASLILDADEGDDNADTWTLQSAASDNDLNFLNHTSEVVTFTSAGTPNFAGATALPANGSTAARITMTTTAGLGLYVGSGAPSVSAAQGSLYLRTDGSSTSTRLYSNSDGGTTWVAVTTAS